MQTLVEIWDNLLNQQRLFPHEKKRKNEVKDNKGIVKYNAQNHSNGNEQEVIPEKKDVGECTQTHSRKSLVKKVFANQ